jgi:hypothetical protein
MKLTAIRNLLHITHRRTVEATAAGESPAPWLMNSLTSVGLK